MKTHTYIYIYLYSHAEKSTYKHIHTYKKTVSGDQEQKNRNLYQKQMLHAENQESSTDSSGEEDNANIERVIQGRESAKLGTKDSDLGSCEDSDDEEDMSEWATYDNLRGKFVGNHLRGGGNGQGHNILNQGHKISNHVKNNLKQGRSILSQGNIVLNPGHNILNPGHSILNQGNSIANGAKCWRLSALRGGEDKRGVKRSWFGWMASMAGANPDAYESDAQNTNEGDKEDTRNNALVNSERNQAQGNDRDVAATDGEAQASVMGHSDTPQDATENSSVAPRLDATGLSQTGMHTVPGDARNNAVSGNDGAGVQTAQARTGRTPRKPGRAGPGPGQTDSGIVNTPRKSARTAGKAVAGAVAGIDADVAAVATDVADGALTSDDVVTPRRSQRLRTVVSYAEPSGRNVFVTRNEDNTPRRTKIAAQTIK
jgi:hypothetical protein